MKQFVDILNEIALSVIMTCAGEEWYLITKQLFPSELWDPIHFSYADIF